MLAPGAATGQGSEREGEESGACGGQHNAGICFVALDGYYDSVEPASFVGRDVFAV